jgi:hypothetical protein
MGKVEIAEEEEEDEQGVGGKFIAANLSKLSRRKWGNRDCAE